MIKYSAIPVDVLSTIPKVKDTLINDQNVVFAYLFGGLAKGKVKPLSDIDIAVYLANVETIKEQAVCKLALFSQLADDLGTSEIDLVVLNSASISLTGRIVLNRRVIVDKAPFFRHTYESITIRKFFDFKEKEKSFSPFIMIDKSLIVRKLLELKTYRKQLAEFAGISIEAYRNDWKTQRIVERTLQIMIEVCADIANHIINAKELRMPNSYADTFKVLSENNIITESLFHSLEKMAKFRNIIVHQYDEVDASIVVLILQSHLVDFERFKKEIGKITG